ncbi:25930_t:CDS:1 [Dentiscutata erythropus]|uniref:25930_t:CDS:1 n=1 Tax=Dentiscutata erythropus TaxID=1348616 RepID=A0A9N9HJ17_9GLOM|nr:25930_t:CDS:1 [Dentiscutata erythropus]
MALLLHSVSETIFGSIQSTEVNTLIESSPPHKKYRISESSVPNTSFFSIKTNNNEESSSPPFADHMLSPQEQQNVNNPIEQCTRPTKPLKIKNFPRLQSTNNRNLHSTLVPVSVTAMPYTSSPKPTKNPTLVLNPNEIDTEPTNLLPNSQANSPTSSNNTSNSTIQSAYQQ